MNLSSHVSHDIFPVVSAEAEKLGVPVFVVGGWVRDLLLKRGSKDIDFVTLGDGIHLAEAVGKKLGVKVSVFKTFGTAHFNYNDCDYEFVGARKESYASTSRKPAVTAGTLQDDQNRRDFTINAFAISLNKENFGDLIDPFNGLSDLNQKIIRTPLDADITYTDDPLRMMRAIRFATQLGFTIEKSSFESISKNIDRMSIVSMERITDELNKIILADKPSVGFSLLFDSGLLQYIFPELCALQGIEVINGVGHKDNFYHTLQVLDNICPNTNNLWLRWAAILHDIAKPPTKRFSAVDGWTFHGHEDLGARMVPGIFKRMRLPLDTKMKYVQKLVRLHLRPIALTGGHVTDSAVRRLIIEAGEDLDDLMTLCEADITTSNKAKEKRYLEKFAHVREFVKMVEERDALRNWQPPVTGEMIMEAFNLKPCREVGDIKLAIREAILEGKIPNTHEDAYQLMLILGKEKGFTSKA